MATTPTVSPHPTTTTATSRRASASRTFGIAAVAVLLAFLGWYFWPEGGNGGAIEEGKSYALAYSYKVYVKESAEAKTVEEGRIFDFADRNIPRSGIPVPISDGRNFLVRENLGLSPSTARKIRERVRARVWEGVKYPGYEFVVWEYNFAHTTNQTHVPTVVLKKD